MSLSDAGLDEVVEKVFLRFDRDKNNSMDPKELHLMLNEAFKKIGKNAATLSQVKDLLKKYDENRDGALSKRELKVMLKDMLPS